MGEPQDILLQKIKDQGDLVRKLKAEKESSEKVSTQYSSFVCKERQSMTNSNGKIEVYNVIASCCH